ncbi:MULTISPECIES: hypothetical protein [unclassified Streptomyces]|uniref:hypothetical protein n=1 Tax=unclassified Streptomyces TaxID=2593676 RepID=UPI001BE87003|nr:MULTISPECIES: hypothetical protein [unclassified Streptomyces]MBT2406332.1 hypothetical protein [Streptomyces sp. ISL-21]MBT2607378.1 hypothetical protein [Streptomyces sp. ISL-87]
MARSKRTLVIGAAFIALIVGCENDGGGIDSESPSHDTPGSRLTELGAISVADDPLTEAEGAVKILSEIRYKQSRLIAYVNGDSCGIVVTPKGGSKEKQMHLVSKWPAGGEGSDSYPAGPYNSASGAGGSKAWASMLCSKNAMVIEYSSGQDASPEQSRGQVAVMRVTDSPATSRIIIGDSGTRRQIEDRAEELGDLARTSPAP